MRNVDRIAISLLSLCFVGMAVALHIQNETTPVLAYSMYFVCGALIYVMISGNLVTFVLWRALLAFFPVAAVVTLIILALMTVSDPTASLTQALIAAIVVAAGWIVGFISQELNRTDQRDELREDLTMALEVEIGFTVARFKDVDWDAAREQANSDFADAPDYRPFIHLQLQCDVIERVMRNVELLANHQIEAVSQYAHVVREVQELTKKLGSEEYGKLDTERRKTILMYFIAQQESIAAAGQRALNVLKDKPYRGLFGRPQ